MANWSSASFLASVLMITRRRRVGCIRTPVGRLDWVPSGRIISRYRMNSQAPRCLERVTYRAQREGEDVAATPDDQVVLAIDQATTNSKALLVRSDGLLVAT